MTGAFTDAKVWVFNVNKISLEKCFPDVEYLSWEQRRIMGGNVNHKMTRVTSIIGHWLRYCVI